MPASNWIFSNWILLRQEMRDGYVDLGIISIEMKVEPWGAGEISGPENVERKEYRAQDRSKECLTWKEKRFRGTGYHQALKSLPWEEGFYLFCLAPEDETWVKKHHLILNYPVGGSLRRY